MIKAPAALVLAAVMTLSAMPATASAAESAPAAAAAPQTIVPGKMIFAANKERLGAIYKVNQDSVQVIVDGKMINLPASTVSLADNGKYVTTLTKAEVLRAR
jgi:hypothetical protein